MDRQIVHNRGLFDQPTADRYGHIRSKSATDSAPGAIVAKHVHSSRRSEERKFISASCALRERLAREEKERHDRELEAARQLAETEKKRAEEAEKRECEEKANSELREKLERQEVAEKYMEREIEYSLRAADAAQRLRQEQMWRQLIPVRP